MGAGGRGSGWQLARPEPIRLVPVTVPTEGRMEDERPASSIRCLCHRRSPGAQFAMERDEAVQAQAAN